MVPYHDITGQLNFTGRIVDPVIIAAASSPHEQMRDLLLGCRIPPQRFQSVQAVGRMCYHTYRQQRPPQDQNSAALLTHLAMTVK